MSDSNPSEPSSSSPIEQPSALAEKQGQPRSTAFRMSPQRWIAILSIALLTLGTGFGWRWLQSSRAEAQTGQAASKSRAVPVKLETTETGKVQETSEFVGTLESQSSVVLKPEITGRVSQILVKSGDRVTAGTPLIQLQPEKRQAEYAGALASVNSARASRATSFAQLQESQADRESARAEVDLQNQQYQRTAVLVKEGALPQQNLDQVVRDLRKARAELNAAEKRVRASEASYRESNAGLQQAQANANLANAELQDAQIVAPFDGTIGDIPVKLGQLVSDTDTLTTVTQNQALDLNLQLPQERRPDLRQGLRVEIIDPKGSVVSTGQISFISPQVDTRTRSTLVKATFGNANGRLRDGDYVRARVIWQESPGILIPTSAISRLGGETFVFVAQKSDQPAGNGQSPKEKATQGEPALVAKQRPVKLGAIQGNQYQVLEGLQPGEQIVVSGLLNLTDGAAIAPQGGAVLQ